jgi:outer membrane protein TolC
MSPTSGLLRAASLAAFVLLCRGASAAPPATAGTPLAADPLLGRLVEESLAARPELRSAEAAARAERERIPQAGALPDPTLSLGIQNDGFDELMIGEMETSFYQVMLSQGLPWPGKRGLRADVARLGAEEAGAVVARARLGTEAEVRRAYVDLLLARERLALLTRLEGIWKSSASTARARYEAGEGAQSDVLRAQLELNRLRLRRFGLEAAERTSLQTLNRLRARPLDEAIATPTTIRDLAAPVLTDEAAAVEEAERKSPELAQARLGARRADAALALARRERYPDLAVNAGIMPRGSFEPMWQAGISIGLPIWSGRKQSRAVAESRARAAADEAGAEAVAQVLALRVAERRTALAALLETVQLYREGLLVQSQATADSTLSQYRAGKVTFASVLEANAGYVADEESFVTALADAQRIAIAADEVSLDPVGALAQGSMGAGAMPGVGAVAGGAGAARAASGAGQGAAPGGAAMPAGM